MLQRVLTLSDDQKLGVSVITPVKSKLQKESNLQGRVARHVSLAGEMQGIAALKSSSTPRDDTLSHRRYLPVGLGRAFVPALFFGLLSPAPLAYKAAARGET